MAVEAIYCKDLAGMLKPLSDKDNFYRIRPPATFLQQFGDWSAASPTRSPSAHFP
jgi:hypothetical protein